MDVPLSRKEIDDFYKGKNKLFILYDSYFIFWHYVRGFVEFQSFTYGYDTPDRIELGYTCDVEKIWREHNYVQVLYDVNIKYLNNSSRRYIS